MELKPIALQLYTLRQAAADDFIGVLRAVADIGYRGVELAGLHGHEPATIARVISDLGMEITSSHELIPTLENVQRLIDTQMTLGNTRVVVGVGPEELESADDCKLVVEKFMLAAELLKPHGLELVFHNHWWEFASAGDRYLYDMIMAETTGIGSELDIYWATYAGANAIDVAARYKERIPLLHVKDGNLEEGFIMTAVGQGKLDIPAIVNAADSPGLRWLIVELDGCATDILEAVKESYAYLVSTGLAFGNK